MVQKHFKRRLLILALLSLFAFPIRPAGALPPPTVPAAANGGVKYEVSLGPELETLVLSPADAFVVPAGEAVKEALPVSPVSPIAAPIQSGSPQPEAGGTSLSAVVYRKFRLPDQTFDPGQSNLSAEGERALAEVAEVLRKDSRWVAIRVDGHTDHVGSEGYNQKTTLERAIFYANYLVANSGIDPGRVFVRGFGESRPLAGNDTPEGRAANRRVEILVLMAPAEGR